MPINYQALHSAAAKSQERRKPCCVVDHVIIDINNLLYRFGHVERREVEGNIIYYPKRIVIKVLEKILFLRHWYGAKDIHIVWEGTGRNWRYDILPSYKSGRDPDLKLRAAVREAEVILRRILSYTNSHFRSWEPVDAEGDDGFGTLAKKLKGKIGIYSSDRDLLQLASDRVTLIVPQRSDADMAMTKAAVLEKYGIPPAAIPEAKGLQSDVGDAIPGVPGFGPKTALELIAKHGTLEKLLDCATSIGLDRKSTESVAAWKRRLKNELGTSPIKFEALRKHVDQARISRDVAKIKCDCQLEELVRHNSDKSFVISEVKELGSSQYLSENFERFAL